MILMVASLHSQKLRWILPIMSSWSTRIKTRMKELEITQEVLARQMGITRGAITHYIAERRVPPLMQFKKLAAILKTDPAWLQFGTVSATKEITPVKKEKTTAAQAPIPILSWNQVAELIDISKIRNDEIKEFVPHIYSDNKRWYALRVKGNSMIASSGYSKSFHEGDIIIVDPDKTAEHGNYVIALLPKSKGATFKQ